MKTKEECRRRGRVEEEEKKEEMQEKKIKEREDLNPACHGQPW